MSFGKSDLHQEKLLLLPSVIPQKDENPPVSKRRIE
jgi:hypothetical protein